MYILIVDKMATITVDNKMKCNKKMVDIPVVYMRNKNHEYSITIRI